MISVIINADSRPQSTEATEMFNGVRGGDLMVESIRNKVKFFEGFKCEFIAYIDEHEHISNDTFRALHDLADCVVVRKHRKHYRGKEPFSPFNDINYLHALSLAKGEYIVHFDQDIAAFRSGFGVVVWLMDILEKFDFVSYPSPHSPNPSDDPTFGNHVWVSTRFFACHKDAIDLKMLEEAIVEPQTLYAKLGTPPRVCPWTEYFLGQMADYSVFYPPLSKDLLIFPWHKYVDGTMTKLNQMPFDDIYHKLVAAGAESYHGCEADRLIL